MNAQPEHADKEVLGTEDEFAPAIGTPDISQWRVDGVNRDLTPLQYHYLSLMRRLISLKDHYQVGAEREEWLMSAINKAIFSTLRDSIEASVGDEAKDLIHPRQPV